MDDDMDVSTVKASFWIMKLFNWKTITKSFLYPLNRLRKPIKIAVYGESGVGKTEFINRMTNTGKHAKRITRDLVRNNFLILDNGRRVEFIDTPGQPSYRSKRFDLMRDYTNHTINGIIHLVSYGYLSKPGDSPDNVFEANSSIIKPTFLENNRKLELDGMDEWLDIITSSNKVNWMLTVVNKADLWYADDTKVRAYYESGDYFAQVTRLNGHCSTGLQYYCSTFKPFMQQITSFAISQEQQEQFHSELMQELYRLIFNP